MEYPVFTFLYQHIHNAWITLNGTPFEKSIPCSTTSHTIFRFRQKGRGCDNRRSIERLYIFFFPDVYLSNVALAHENDGVKSFNFMTQQSRRQQKETKTRRGSRGGNGDGDGDDDDGAKKLTKRAIINTKRGLEAVEDRQQCCRSLRSELNWPTRKHTHTHTEKEYWCVCWRSLAAHSLSHSGRCPTVSGIRHN